MDAMLARRYTRYRNKLHTHYEKITEKGNNLCEHPYEALSTNVYNNLCDLFESEKFQKRSVANKKNRRKLLYNHVSGSKAYTTCLPTKNPKTGTCLDIFDVYRDTHQRADRTWVAPTAENLYRQMMEMKEKPIEEGEKPMSDEEIREAVLGHKLGYVRGLGLGPKPTSTRGSTSCRGPTQEDFDNMKAQIEALTQMIVQQSYGGMEPSLSS